MHPLRTMPPATQVPDTRQVDHEEEGHSRDDGVCRDIYHPLHCAAVITLFGGTQCQGWSSCRYGCRSVQ